ncbi:MAG: MerR family transcriptional regulator [Schleiferiaceae bacterium]|jgi:DNA-binding transcriptional MerR regulator|nr:MerR family transcriptional regulator [Schleiferiaceae bacterium]
MSIKTSFSIKDLENLSGIKAHTIRIWEKRYNLLTPIRTDTNIRTYNVDNLTKILNISLLNQNGIKISKIADLSENEINERVRQLILDRSSSDHALNAFKLSMLNFDQQLFNNTFNQLLAQQSFREIFLNIILKFLDDIGHLWTSKTITPSHEHFVSTLIKQKLLLNIERVQNAELNKTKTMVLFLPMNEIHDLGLLYIHFELLIKGYKSVYLGESVPVDNLIELQKVFPEIAFVSYFTVSPPVEDSEVYLADMVKHVLNDRGEEFHILGRNTRHLDKLRLPDNIKVHENIPEFLKHF